MASTVSPYQTALELKRPRPAWVPGKDDADRVTVYQTYEDIYNNVKDAFKALLRDAAGEEQYRRLPPAARTIVEATNRYLAKDPSLVSTIPANVTVSPEAQAAFMEQLKALWKREEVTTKFLSMKRWMLIRGDALLHISADPSKPEGSRISLMEIQPDSYFPIHDTIDPTRVVGAYVVTIVLADDGETPIAQRVEYRKVRTPEDSAEFNGAPVGTVFYRVGYYETNAWDDREPLFDETDLKLVEVPSWAKPAEGIPDYIAGYALPTEITSIPLYHYRNNRTGNEPFGRSELQGIETLLVGIAQTMSDEELTVALTGLGVYKTTSGPPKNDDGSDGEWIVAPASVIELEDEKDFERVEGITDLKPLLQHTDALKSEARETTATPDVAVGRVDVQTAESGVALAISMAPIIAKNEEKEEELKGKTDQLLYDLTNMWLPAYEGAKATGLIVEIQFGSPLPVNEDAIVTNVSTLVEKKVIPIRFALQLLKDKLGWDIDPATLAAELMAQETAALDAAAARIDAEAAPDVPTA
jgi:SPP1 Gp6-like portal protein